MERVTPDLFGKIGKDMITGFEGVIVGVTDWMFGCQSVILVATGKKKRRKDSESVSIKKLEVVGDGPKLDMEIPEYEPPKYFGKICRDKVTGYTGMVIGRTWVFYSSPQYYLEAKVTKGKPIPPIFVDEGRLEVIEDSPLAMEPEEVQSKHPGGVDIDFRQFL